MERGAKRVKVDAKDEACAAATSASASIEQTPATSKENAYESEEAWAAWEVEMAQYRGWENEYVVVREGPADSATATVIEDMLIGELLEDMEIRASIVRTMSEAGVPPQVLRDLYTSHVRTFVFGSGVEGSGGGGAAAAAESTGGSTRRVYLAHDEERNLHVTVFGWGRFRRQDIAFIMKAGHNGPFIELGAGSGWLGKCEVPTHSATHLLLAVFLTTRLPPNSLPSSLIRGAGGRI